VTRAACSADVRPSVKIRRSRAFFMKCILNNGMESEFRQ